MQLGGVPGAALLEDSSLCPRLLACRPSACEAGLGCAEHRLEADATGKKAMRRMALAARMRSASEPRLAWMRRMSAASSLRWASWALKDSGVMGGSNEEMAKGPNGQIAKWGGGKTPASTPGQKT